MRICPVTPKMVLQNFKFPVTPSPCFVRIRTYVVSKYNIDKWFVTKEEWPGETYPIFCLGNGYAISREWMENIYSMVKLGGFFWVDDVLLMGKLRTIAEKKFNETTKMR